MVWLRHVAYALFGVLLSLMVGQVSNFINLQSTLEDALLPIPDDFGTMPINPSPTPPSGGNVTSQTVVDVTFQTNFPYDPNPPSAGTVSSYMLILSVDGKPMGFLDTSRGTLGSFQVYFVGAVKFTWDVGTTHTYAWEPVIDCSRSCGNNGGHKSVWESTTGLASGQSGTITASTSGSITATYRTEVVTPPTTTTSIATDCGGLTFGLATPIPAGICRHSGYRYFTFTVSDQKYYVAVNGILDVPFSQFSAPEYHYGYTLSLSGNTVILRPWDPFGGRFEVDDFDLYVYDSNQKLIGSGEQKAGIVEVVEIIAPAPTPIPTTSPRAPVQSTTLYITAETDKTSYLKGDQGLVSGMAYVNGAPASGVSISIQVEDPSGRLVGTTATQSSFSGSYSKGFTLSSSTPAGDYTIIVNGYYEGATFSTAARFLVPVPTQTTPMSPRQQIPTPVPTQPLAQGTISVSTDKSSYNLGDSVTLGVKFSGVGSGENIAVSVTDSTGKSVVTRTITTDRQGLADLRFKISESYETGTYQVIVTSSVGGENYKDSTQFTIRSQSSKLSIISVQLTDQQGNPVSSFSRGTNGFVKVVVSTESSQVALVTVNLFDSGSTSLGIGSFKTTLGAGESEMILSFFIPKDAIVGSADVYANAFSDWPSRGGTPLTGESSSSVGIK